MRTPTVLSLACLLAAAASAAADTLQVPVPARAGDTFGAKIEPVGDIDPYALFLAAGDVLQVNCHETGPQVGLFSNLHLIDPSGVDITPVVKGQNKQKASFKFKTVTTGTYVVTVGGNPTGGGRMGDYQLALTVRRVKPPAAKFDAAAGGPISVRFTTPTGSSLSLTATTKKGGFDLTGILRPDGTPEPGFTAALKAKNRLKATLSKYPLTGGDGEYELQGNFDAGSKVAVKVSVAANDGKHKRKLGDELRIDPQLLPFPTAGIAGTVISVSAVNFDDFAIVDDQGNVTGHKYATFTLGGFVVPPATIQHPNGAIFKFPVPANLVVDQTYDLTVVNADGQGQTVADAFYLAPAPVITGLSIATAGPAGGRTVSILGLNLRTGSSIMFDTTIVQPINDGVHPDHLEVIAPAHAPGTVTLSLRDDFGQLATAADAFTYLDVGSNRITSISPTYFQAVGGETITVNGADFAADTVLTLDGVPMAHNLVSSSVLTFVTPEHADAAVKLRVTDLIEQTSAVDVQIEGFVNTTATSIPSPVTTNNGVDGWRATRVLVGDVTGDGKPDVVILRPEKAFGPDAERSRLRLLVSNGNGAFSDATVSKIPAVSGDEDWRAQDGVLVDIDGDTDLDIAIITDEQISGGNRSSLRVLQNDGTGTFTDVTATAVPASTTYGDVNQGVAIAAGNFDGVNGELVIVRDDKFTETIVTSGGPPNPPNPPPPDIIVTNYYPGLRVLTNDTHGVFSRKITALPTVTATSAVAFQGKAVAVGNVDGQNRDDIVVTQALPVADPANAGVFLRATTLLRNDTGNAVFTDVSSSKLPAKSDPEYLQGDRVYLADADGDSDLDLVLASSSRLVSPVTTLPATSPATRVFANNGTGTFTAPSAQPLPAAEDQDSSQADAVVVADFTGDGKAELFVVSTHAPNFSGHATRALVQLAGAWQRGSEGLPDPISGDDLRGADAAAIDIDGDGDLDVVIVRDEANDSVRSTLVLKNPRK